MGESAVPVLSTGKDANIPIGHSNRGNAGDCGDVANGDADSSAQHKQTLHRDVVRRGQWLVSTEALPEPPLAIQAF